MLAKQKKVPSWVIRWEGGFGIVYLGKDPATAGMKDWRGLTVYSIELAFKYPSKDAAESAAVVFAAKYPRFLGQLEAREWDGRRKRP